MITKEDFSTINTPLVNAGYAHTAIHSLHFDRIFTEEEQKANAEEFERLSPSEWGERCERFWKAFAEQNVLLIRAANDYFIRETGKALCQFDDLEQDNPESRRQHERYHLWLWYNEDARFFSLTVLEADWPHKENITNPEIIPKVLEWFNIYAPDTLSCRIQYHTIRHEAEIEAAAFDIYQYELKDKFVQWGFDTGKVGWDKNAQRFYFMKKYAKRKGVYLSPESLFTMKPIEA